MDNHKIRNQHNKCRQAIIGILFLMVACLSCFYLHQRSIYTEIPDLSSTYDSGGNYYMSIVSNSKEIPDKGAFAEQIVQMSRDNAFQTIKFCVEEKGYPQIMNVTVYHTSKEIGNGSPVFHFRYEPDDYNAEYDIYHNPENYKLVIE